MQLNIDEYEAYLLAIAVWREARGEGYDGMLAVAYTLMTRVRHPRWWGKDLVDVIAMRYQVSSMTDAHDPQLTYWPRRGDASFETAMKASVDAIEETVPNPVETADHYHDHTVKPKWAEPQYFVKRIGKLMFYSLERKDRRPGLPAAEPLS